MIVGLGVDIAEVDRVRGAMGGRGEILKRLYTAKSAGVLREVKNKYERTRGGCCEGSDDEALGTG